MVSLAVLGAGNAGCSLAGEMTLEGHDVSLAELPQFKTNLEVPVRKGGIEVAGELKTGFAKIKKMTMDIKDAIKGRELIFITSPAFGHEAFTRACAPYLEKDQALIYISYFGALRMAKLLKELGVDHDKITVAETASFVYACDRVGKKGAFFMDRYQDDARVLIKREMDNLPLAAFPAAKTAEALRTVPAGSWGDTVDAGFMSGSRAMFLDILSGHWTYHTGQVGYIQRLYGDLSFA
jgi:opine dehydrogenase